MEVGSVFRKNKTVINIQLTGFNFEIEGATLRLGGYYLRK
jgi:hypothetical protein